ncbi:MAG: DoxX family protein [Ignavibacteriales bacterium]|nr:DoxX family protein [Ignavibacteriales bacterium]
MKIVYVGIRILLGAVFILSGFFKILSPQSASQVVIALLSTSVTTSSVLVIILSIIEMVLGFALLVGKKLQLVSAVSSLFLLGFIFIGLFLIANPVPCGCFGNLIESKTDEWFLARNTIFLLMSLSVMCHSTNSPTQIQREDTTP